MDPQREAALKEMADFLAKVEAAGYSTEGGIPQAFFVEEYGPAWAWTEDSPERTEMMRDYFVSTHPGEPPPAALEPGYTGKAPVTEKIGTWALWGVLALVLLAVVGRGTNKRSEAA